MRNQYIRSSLRANREDRVNNRRRANDESFGIYRPITTESEAQLRPILEAAKQEIDIYLEKERPEAAKLAQLVMANDFGVTFVPRLHVRRAMRFGMLQQGFEFGRMMERVERHVDEQPDSLPVPLARGFEWYGQQDPQRAGRKLVALLARSEATDELRAQAVAVEGMLEHANAPEIHVQTPNHISLFKYGRFGDGQDLAYRHRVRVEDILEDHFRAAEIREIELGRLVVGTSYKEPLLVAS